MEIDTLEDTLESSRVKATAVSVRVRIYLFALTNTNIGIVALDPLLPHLWLQPSIHHGGDMVSSVRAEIE